VEVVAVAAAVPRETGEMSGHWRRMCKHLLTPDWMALQAFPAAVLDRIEQAIMASEKRHSGELRIALEASLEPLQVLRGQSARDRAHEVFARLRVWDTEGDSGVLIYLQMVDRKIEIVADRGISRRVEQARWDAICGRMEAAFRAGRFEQGVVHAIDEITELLAAHFPPGTENPDELPNRPVVLL